MSIRTPALPPFGNPSFFFSTILSTHHSSTCSKYSALYTRLNFRLFVIQASSKFTTFSSLYRPLLPPLKSIFLYFNQLLSTSLKHTRMSYTASTTANSACYSYCSYLPFKYTQVFSALLVHFGKLDKAYQLLS